jgi:hypothetical protein
MKWLPAIICLLLLSGNSLAQNKLQTGMTIGYNSSTFLGHDKPGKLKSIPGLYLGGIINYPINKRISLLSNVSISSKGTEFSAVDNLTEAVVYLYLDMPIIVKMDLLVDKKISPFIVLGSAFDYCILAVGTGGSLFDVKNIDLGIVSGIGFDLGKISIGIRYNHSITKFDNSYLKADLRNSSLSILMGITFKE